MSSRVNPIDAVSLELNWLWPSWTSRDAARSQRGSRALLAHAIAARTANYESMCQKLRSLGVLMVEGVDLASSEWRLRCWLWSQLGISLMSLADRNALGPLTCAIFKRDRGKMLRMLEKSRRFHAIFQLKSCFSVCQSFL